MQNFLGLELSSIHKKRDGEKDLTLIMCGGDVKNGGDSLSNKRLHSYHAQHIHTNLRKRQQTTTTCVYTGRSKKVSPYRMISIKS